MSTLGLHLALCAVMSGAQGWDDIEDWERAREGWLRNGIPGHDTIRRVFEALSPRQLAASFSSWMAQVCPAVSGLVIAIDGKSLRGAARPACGLRALHQVSAYAAEYGLTLGPLACQEKSNEITAIGELLPTLALEGAVVTIDAMGCQTAIAEQIVDGGGDYVLAVKDNQPHLAHALRDFFGMLDAPGYPDRQTCVHETLDKGHGRIETRRCTAVGDLDWLATLGLKERCKKITSVACIDSSRVIGSKTETDRRYVISSLPADSERILHAVRMHWGIENGLHWCLDVTFGEDACPIRLRNAALNLSLPRRAAMNLFRADQSRSMSLPKKRKAAAWNPDYLANILHLREILCSCPGPPWFFELIRDACFHRR
ncbi:ISAs1 family transposase [Verminephrobacter eiseniae]|uniref:ISAs1 family transposase n=1 Tax=Verminephrobacter eiseniae TaxID=364317 RepID=UPI002238437E|nr:ISAs1 family transposase [Verminephrobacter eiseniae]